MTNKEKYDIIRSTYGGNFVRRKEDKIIILFKALLEKKLEELKKDNSTIRLSNQIACLNEIIDIMEINEFDYILSNIMQISLNLSTIYGDEEALKIEMEIRGLLRNALKYKDNPYFQDEYLKSTKKLRGYYHRFNNEKENLGKKHKELKDNIIKYSSYLCKINYGQIFRKEQIKDVQKFLDEEKVDKKLALYILELLFIRNSEIANSTPQQFMNSRVYKEKLLKVLTIGFEQYDTRIKNYSNEKELEDMGDIIDKTIECWDLYYQDFETKGFECQLPTLESYDKFKLYNFYVLFMEKLQEKMLEQLENIQDNDFFMDLETKREIIFDFNKYKNLYLCVRNFYDDIFDKLIEEMKLQQEVVENIEEEKNKLLFLRNDDDEVLILKDLEKTNPEYLPKVAKLLQDKKDGKTIEQKNTDKQIVSNNKLKQYRELKDDQIRIIYRNLEDNKVLIIGCGTKKDNVDYTMLNSMKKKYDTFYNKNLMKHYIEESDKDFEACINYCENNKRKGTR